MVVLACLLIFVTFLMFEAIYAHLKRNSIRLRIAVTGVRGKSSVTRLITFALRQNGMKVLGKVTGSKPVLIYPDGEEKIIERKRKPLVTEQIRVFLKTANRLAVEGFVCETMSVNPEILRCEIQNILKPHIVVIARITVDHVEELGNSIKEVRKNIVSACNYGSTVITTKGNLDRSSLEILRKKECTVIEIEPHEQIIKPGDYLEFDENLILASAVCEFIGLQKEKITKIFTDVPGDIGALRCWRINNGVIAINGFAANDPDSTIKVFEKAKQFLIQNGLVDPKFVGVLNLRPDRVDRTAQWLRQLKTWFPFERLYVTGPDNVLFVRRLGNSKCLPMKIESVLTEINKLESGTIVFGFGNIADTGLKLIDQWQESERCLKSQL